MKRKRFVPQPVPFSRCSRQSPMIKVVFFGTPQFAVASLHALLNSDCCQVVGVVTQPDKHRGRGQQLSPSPVKWVAVDHGLPVFQPQRIRTDTPTIIQLHQLQADLFVVVAYGQILSPEILQIPPLGCVNVHGSLLPAYRGAAPIQWSLYHGEAMTGITTMLMDEGMDTGAMLLKRTMPVQLLDDAPTVTPQLAELGAQLLLETIQTLLSIGIIPTPQNSEYATYAPRISKKDFPLDWHRPALSLHNQIRGFTPDCTTLFRHQPLRVVASAPLGDSYWVQLPEELAAIAHQWSSITPMVNPKPVPGEIIHLVKAIGPIVQTGDGLLLIRRVQLPGKRVQTGWDFVNGLRLKIGEAFING